MRASRAPVPQVCRDAVLRYEHSRGLNYSTFVRARLDTLILAPSMLVCEARTQTP